MTQREREIRAAGDEHPRTHEVRRHPDPVAQPPIPLPAIADDPRCPRRDRESESDVRVGFPAPLTDVHECSRRVRLGDGRGRGLEAMPPPLLGGTSDQRHRHVREDAVGQDRTDERPQHISERADTIAIDDDVVAEDVPGVPDDRLLEFVNAGHALSTGRYAARSARGSVELERFRVHVHDVRMLGLLPDQSGDPVAGVVDGLTGDEVVGVLHVIACDTRD